MLRARAQGFSLVELMVALATTAVVVVYAMETFTTQHQTYVVIDDVSETQQGLRAIASLIERDIRNAGYMVPPAAAACGVDRTDAPDLLFVSDADAILPCCSPPEPAGQALDRTFSSSPLAATTTGSFSVGATSVSLDDVTIDGNATYDSDGDGIRDSDFQVEAGAILVDVANPERGVACGFVTAVNGGSSIDVDFVATLDNTVVLSSGSELRVVPAHVYEVLDVAGTPRLERNGMMLAKDVEDLQVAFYYDDDRDGEVDVPGEIRGVPGVAYDTQLIDGSDLREIRFNVVIRTPGVDPRNPNSAGAGQSTENRNVGVPGADGRRRRVETATVRLRNVSL